MSNKIENKVSDKKTLKAFKEKIGIANKFAGHLKDLINECSKKINNIDPDDSDRVKEFVFAFYSLDTLMDYLNNGFDQDLFKKIESLQKNVKDLQEKRNMN